MFANAMPIRKMSFGYVKMSQFVSFSKKTHWQTRQKILIYRMKLRGAVSLLFCKMPTLAGSKLEVPIS